jgi:ABC-type antimicrobial peptide transport system permease subunit
MLTNFFKIAWRNLLRNKTFSIINISGLSVGMACTLLILLWVYNEKSWDGFHKNYDNIYHVFANRNFNGEITTGPDMMYPLPKAAKMNFPEVQSAAIVSFGETTLFTVGDKKINKRTINSSPDFFDIFSFKFLQGSASALKDPNAVILTKSTAEALFGTSNAVGQSVEVNNGRTAIVKAVIDDVPKNSTLQFEGVIPFNPSSPQIVESENDWVNCGNRVFFKLQPNANIPALEKKVLTLIKEHSTENPTTRGSVVLHPMNKWRLYEEFKDGKNTGGRIEYVNMFTWIALIILLIACVNFMNLSTARSEKRAKEVGVRKTLGSLRKQLLWQFITESVLLSFIGFIIAAAIVYLVVPAFGRMLDENIVIPYSSPYLWLIAAGIIIVTGFMAGSYPAFYLSGFSPVKVLKGTFLPGKNALLPRKILVTGQFIVSIVLISATLIVYQQLQFVKNRDIGYDPNNLLMVNSSPDTDKSYSAIKNDLLQSGYVESVNRSSNPVTTILGYTSGVRWPNAPSDPNLVIGFLFTGGDFAKTLNAKVIEGRDFQMSDTNTVLFNKEAIRIMGLKNPVGQEITWAGKPRRIVGVVDNIVMLSPYQAPTPMMFAYADFSGNINIRLTKNADLRKSIAGIENIYKKYSDAYPFEFKFVDEEFNKKYVNEELIGKIAIVFAGLAIFICCLGLFGLVASSIERRKKEIGVRKVLGATVQNLLMLMSKEFLILVGLAFLVAIPAAWWAMNKWLENYSYRISVGIGIFMLVGIITLLITLITVSLNASKAALSSPTRSLRSE